MFTFNVVKSTLYVLLLALCFASTHAQKTYFGVGGSYVTSSAYASVPLVSLQVGGPTAPEFGSLEVRAALDTILLFSNSLRCVLPTPRCGSISGVARISLSLRL